MRARARAAFRFSETARYRRWRRWYRSLTQQRGHLRSQLPQPLLDWGAGVQPGCSGQRHLGVSEVAELERRDTLPEVRRGVAAIEPERAVSVLHRRFETCKFRVRGGAVNERAQDSAKISRQILQVGFDGNGVCRDRASKETVAASPSDEEQMAIIFLQRWLLRALK